jgi:hypothetical protein
MKLKSKYSLVELIENANSAQIDAIWAILKYREIGIFRKIFCIAEVFGENADDLLEDLPQDDNGRILDQKTRNLIHDALVEVS